MSDHDDHDDQELELGRRLAAMEQLYNAVLDSKVTRQGVDFMFRARLLLRITDDEPEAAPEPPRRNTTRSAKRRLMGRRHRHLQREAAAERKLYGTGRAAVHATPATKPGGMTFQRRKVVQLADDTLGFAMLGERGDDCFRAALGTCPRDLPDMKIDERVIAGDDPEMINLDVWTRLLRWLDERGLCLVLHDTPPTDCERWIGVTPPPPGAVNVARLVEDELHRPDVTRRDRRRI